jgi:hypothetical protein
MRQIVHAYLGREQMGQLEPREKYGELGMEEQIILCSLYDAPALSRNLLKRSEQIGGVPLWKHITNMAHLLAFCIYGLRCTLAHLHILQG